MHGMVRQLKRWMPMREGLLVTRRGAGPRLCGVSSARLRRCLCVACHTDSLSASIFNSGIVEESSIQSLIRYYNDFMQNDISVSA